MGKSFWKPSKPKYMGLCYLNWTSNIFTSRDSMTLNWLCNQFQCLSMSTFISLFILSPLLQFKPLFYLPSITDTVRRLFLLQQPVFLKMALYISPQDLKSSEFLSCPSQVAHSLQLWDMLPSPFTQLPPPCSDSNMWCEELDTPFQVRPCKHVSKRKGCFPCPTGSTVYTLEHYIFLYSLGLLIHI